MIKILDGKKVRDFLSEKLKEKIAKMGKKPKLVIFQVGNDERSSVYIKQKKIFGEKIGFDVEYIQLENTASEGEIISKINQKNADENVSGIIVQMPLPVNFNAVKIIDTIRPEKDADGLTSANIKKFFVNDKTAIVPATAKGIISLLDFYEIEIAGKKVVVVGRSLIAGRSIANVFLNRDATVTICHSKTKDLKEETKSADILVVAVGKAEFIKRDFVREEQVIIDVGINKMKNGICGDVDFENVSKIVSAISPVPGGVGPMTVISLFENIL
ncbi:MAG: bifunctional 5,10-methylenetetrahydrofolate dehydrogenase/5,10-methenyltetrahydrofolate cyclohydrolase [Candidatus Paceibacterota bacterium]|jgi:methylenetetrahydrofolate dehydrogenase (NADP+)/methenyltetrahydrofolate cyclohydrolase